jgi:hypothetical protein
MFQDEVSEMKIDVSIQFILWRFKLETKHSFKITEIVLYAFWYLKTFLTKTNKHQRIVMLFYKMVVALDLKLCTPLESK